ncbi:hypothetical protein HU200_038485 [Digitaria exilis]|uniref:F-box domain-containing protein n=1 Tax=Digitaria exilis TaxID=1010633 RepID=A0A835EKE2_9POAL|nr:hypothetical protein HU200_038485 [Digitaria exilis]
MQDIWCHILSLVPLSDAARASCVSRAFLHAWRCRPNLILNQDTLRSRTHVSKEDFRHTLDCILRRHLGVGVKTLHLISAKIKYNFPCSLLSEGIRNSIRHLKLGYCAFRPTPELGPLRSLTSLCFHTVGITGYELECFFSHSRALEQLTLFNCQEIICLKIPCELQQLNSLRASGCYGLKVIENKAPNLSNLNISGKVKLSGEILQMKHLGMFFGNVVSYARSELPSILPNLETLYLTSNNEDHTPMLPTKFMYLKQLTISTTSVSTFPPSYDYCSLVSFLDASPLLETLVLEVIQLCMQHASVSDNSSSLRQIDERNYCCLKSVKISGFTSAKSLVELTCHILKNAKSLESVTLDTCFGWRCSDKNHEWCFPLRDGIRREAPRALKAIRTYIADKVPATAKFSVLEPCRRCHKV